MKFLNTRMFILLVALAVVGLIGTDSAIAQDDDIAPEIIYYDYSDDNGVLKGGMIKVYADSPLHSKYKDPNQLELDSYQEWDVYTIIDNGPIGNRVDLVILGDGYQESELDDYADDVSNVIDGFFKESPLDEYASYFNVHRVDVISTDSGVDHDPCYPIWRDTELDMGFWSLYQGERLERLLTIGDTAAAYAAANQAPNKDKVMALANSTKHGGSGGLYICLSGGHEDRAETALHEFGHSFGDLADEYFDPNGEVYSGDGSDLILKANTSILEAEDMNDANEKWYRWLDWGPEPKDVWTFPGAVVWNKTIGDYVDYNDGVYRPTDWSMMRDLDYPFYQVNTEQLIFKIYEIVEAVDYATPGGTYPLGTKFFVQPLQPATHSLDVQWYLDGDAIPGATGTEFDSSTLDKPTGQYTLDVNVVDNTEMVRDPNERERLMTDSRTWTLGEAGHWKFDEGTGDIAYDSIGDNNGILGAPGGADPCDPNWVNDPNRGWCLDFDGDDDYVSLSDMNALADNTTTIAAWIKADDLSEDYNPIVTQCKEEGGYYYGYSLCVDGDVNKPTFYLGGDLAQSTEAINEGQWYHIAGTYDGSTLKIYVNGVQRGTKTSSKSGTHHDAYIGYDDVIGADFFSGTIDDVRVYDWAMDQAQIWEIMSAGASKFCVKDNYRVLMAWFDDSGNLFLRGSFEPNTTPEANDSIDEFRFQGADGNDLAIIGDNGNMYIYGSLHEDQNSLNPGGNNHFVIKDSSGDEVAYIDDPNGDLYLKGELYQNPE